MTQKKTDDETAVHDEIADLEPSPDVAARLHEVITPAAPELKQRLWYGLKPTRETTR